jgi:lipopolysaccharide transport system permease protein
VSGILVFLRAGMKTIITSADRSFISFRELKNYSGLFRYLSLRDVFVRYKQTRMGFTWSIVRPAVNILIFGFLSWLVDRSDSFSEKFVQVSAGIVFWQLLSATISDVSNSLSSNSNILTKVYFPKILLPLSGILVCLVDFLIAFVLFLIIYFVFKGLPPWQVVLLPVFILPGLVFAFSIGLAAATASVRFRDVKFILPFLVQVLFYASPVFISSEYFLSLPLPSFLKTIYMLNPFVFILNGFKYCMFGHFESFNPFFVALSLLIIILTLYASIRYFLSFEKSFVDHI